MLSLWSKNMQIAEQLHNVRSMSVSPLFYSRLSDPTFQTVRYP